VVTNSKGDDQDLVSIQAVYQSDSESEESLSGDDREENTEISEIAIQNVIVEDPVTEEEEKANTQIAVEENIEPSEYAEEIVELIHQDPLDSNPKESMQQCLSAEIKLNLSSDQSNPTNAEIDENKSSAALSTLRKLKFKKVSLDNFPLDVIHNLTF
jgi:hypothetical protein